jgi:hypothetical protein
MKVDEMQTYLGSATAFSDIRKSALAIFHHAISWCLCNALLCLHVPPKDMNSALLELLDDASMDLY